MPRTTPLLAFTAMTLLAGTAPGPPDLDVGIPPGSPTEWGQRFPAITPRSRPLFPLTGDRDLSPEDKARTVAARAVPELEVEIAGTFGIIRILTWDVGGHLAWVNAPLASGNAPVTGVPSGAATHETGAALHWITAAGFLRVLLHPQLVSEKELIAYLVEVGEPTLELVPAARAEPALADLCRELQARIGVGRLPAQPVPGASPRATMLSRFVHDELLSASPYDPEGGFGRRMFLFAEEVEPLLVSYASHEDPLLRRNAVAALARYHTRAASDTLLLTAVRPADPVAQMRALAGMDGRRELRDPEVLLQRLQLSTDPVEQAALIQALGRMELREAVPVLLGLAGPDVDSDLLMAILAALVRIRPAGGAEEVLSFAGNLAARAESDPDRFQIRRDEPAPGADRPDSPRTRGQVIAQLAALLQARLRPGDEDVVRSVVELIPQAPPSGGQPAGNFTNASMSAVFPPVQMLFLETLHDLGPEGHGRLRTVAADTSTEPVLRGRALALLAADERSSLAVKTLESTSESEEMKIYAVEALGLEGHERLRELAAPMLAECADVTAAAPSPEQRYLWLTALRALERRGLLEGSDLVPLLARVTAPMVAKADVIETIRGLVESLVNEAAVGMTRTRLGERLTEILTPIIENGINHTITAETERSARDHVTRQLQDLRRRRNDTGYQRLVAEDILRYLVGFEVRHLDGNRGEFAPVVLLEEEILLTLGRSDSPEAAAALASFLQEESDNPFRAHACLAAGTTGRRDLARYLVPYLLDGDGLVRFCAYESLRHLAGEEYWADWMYGSPDERGSAAQQWFRWSIRNR